LGKDRISCLVRASTQPLEKRRADILDDNRQNAYTQHNRRPRLPVARLQGGGVLILGKHAILLVALLLLTSGCSSPAATSTAKPPRATPNASLTLTPPTAPTVVPTANRTSSPTQSECLETSGSISNVEVDDPSLVRALPYRVYLPPCFDHERETPYPTLYLLHGLTYTDSQWDELGIDETADGLIIDGQIPPLIIVMPWKRTGIDLENAVVDVLVPLIDQTHPTGRSPEWRAIGGISRGGGWALRIGLRHTDVFGAIGLHSPATISSPPYIVRWIGQIPEASIPRLWIDIGESDSLNKAVSDLLSIFDEHGMPYTAQVSPGNHTPAYWTAQLETYLRWYTSGWPNASSLDAP
jgi:enterochelin esterase-like enzyme